jgi:hypothetical protein
LINTQRAIFFEAGWKAWLIRFSKIMIYYLFTLLAQRLAEREKHIKRPGSGYFKQISGNIVITRDTTYEAFDNILMT